MSSLGRFNPPKKVALLGGSFNPAHEGHLHISLMALRRLKVDQVWWLVSPQNPLKPVKGMAPLGERLASARLQAKHPCIKVMDLESQLGTFYTAHMLKALTQQFKGSKFLWVMGADNLEQIPLWKDWEKIFSTVSVAVFDRPGYALKALSGKAAQRFSKDRIGENKAGSLVMLAPPRWVFLHGVLHPASSTQIRASKNTK
ncbi:MAG: nicotinate-nucleotide adenylyltransferase [Alphaproteobacteria bacterium]|nr:nicotinate-nucleotide adenylyltransferase [Alphaproteobacteria bacterium]